MPSLRRRQDPPAHQAEPFSDSDELDEEDEDMVEGVTMGDEADVIEGEDEDDEDEEEPLASPHLDTTHAPIPHNLREISTLASWTVSSSKPGCSVPQLRSPSTSLFWQSDGPQPHYLNIHFFKLVRIVGLRLYLDFEADESYTPTRIVFLAGSGGNDLVEWGEMRLEQPRGWIWADFSGVGDADSDDDGEDEDDEEGDADVNDGVSDSESIAIPGLAEALVAHDGEGSDFENARPRAAVPTGVPVLMDLLDAGPALGPGPTFRTPDTAMRTPGNISSPILARNHPRLPFTPLHPTPRAPKMPVLRAHLVQIKILENHQNGKDTHLRGLQIFAKDKQRDRPERAAASPIKAVTTKVSNGIGKGMTKGLGRSEWEMEGSIR